MQKVDLLAARQFEQQVQRAFIPAHIDCEQVAGFGRRLVTVPYRDDKEDLDALAAAAERERAKIVYLSNPDNPMGTWWSGAAVEAFIDMLPDETLLILDEAYGELAPDGVRPSIDTGRRNVLRFRTFSKAYGLAGLRVGYAFGPADLCVQYNKVRDHFGVNVMAQHAALAALGDQKWLEQVSVQFEAARKHIAAIATANGLVPLPSATNFVTIDCGRDGDYARALVGALAEEGIFVRMPFVAPEDRCIRVSAGTAGDLDAFAEGLPRALATIG